MLWAGDLLFHKRIPSLDGSVNGWLEVMDELRDVIATNGCLAQAVDSVGVNERKNWLLFDDYHPGNVARAFT